MAKSSLLTKRGPKKPTKVTKTEKRIITEKFYGAEEPKIPAGVLDGAPYSKALYWYNVMADFDHDLKDYVVKYLKGQGRLEESDRMSRVPDKWISPTLGAQARLLGRGARLSSQSMARMEEFIRDALAHENSPIEDDPDSEPVEKVSMEERKSERSSFLIGELEGLIDDGFYEKFTLDGWFVKNNVKEYTIRAIIDKFEPMRAQLRQAIKLSKKECMEEFGHDKEEAEVFHDMYDWLIEDAKRYILNQKQMKKPRAKKPQSAEKKLKFLADTYQKHSAEYNISSIDPGKILGAQELWTFNTKYKLITVFRAEGFGGKLDVARCKIIGFDKNNSTSFRAGRKTESIVDQVMKGTKAQLKKLDLKPCTLQERINENTILLKVY